MADAESDHEDAADASADTAVGDPAVTDTDGTPVDSVLIGDDLTLRYPTSDDAVVACARLDVPEGEVTGLIGPNGSGKSTILKALSNHLEPAEGRVLLDGQDVQSFARKDLATELGLLSQERDAPESITVRDLAYHGRYPHRGFFDGMAERDHEIVDDALSMAGVEHLADQELGQLSGGQKQLAWIAMVLAQDTDVLLLDEPTTFLDLHNQLKVLETVRQLNDRQGTTVCVVLHDVAQAARFADYLIALEDGELYDWGPPEDVVTERMLADVFGVEATVRRDGEVQVTPRRALPDE